MADPKKLTIVCGGNTQVFEDIEQVSIREIRNRLVDVMNIPNPSQAIMGGRTVSDDFIVDLIAEGAEDVQIEFVKPAGDKG